MAMDVAFIKSTAKVKQIHKLLPVQRGEGWGGGHTWLKITIKSEIIAHKFELTNKGVHTNLN